MLFVHKLTFLTQSYLGLSHLDNEIRELILKSFSRTPLHGLNFYSYTLDFSSKSSNILKN